MCTLKVKTDLCIIGGGLSGTIAALSAARHGAKVVLVQDRPMLGGNASSEIRMWVRGASGLENRETGILTEFEEENIYRNPTLCPTLWDSVLFGKVKEEENITLFLNTTCVDATYEEDKIISVKAWQLTTYNWIEIEADLFADCSGDSILAHLTPALHRKGREAQSEYNETIGPEIADSKTMGMSCLLAARETDHEVPFIPPTWANVYKSDEDFAAVPCTQEKYSTVREHDIATSGSNLWWIELGGDGDSIKDTENVRDELLKIALGIWDHLKNQEDHGYGNWELEWVGFLPGKRESIRYIGEHVLTQHDVEGGGKFDDVVAYGGWTMDDHNPKGFKADCRYEHPSIMFPAPSPFGIPYRCLYSKNMKNLMFAGRNISATHAAISSTRVMATCSLLGQAMGTAAAICINKNLLPNELSGSCVEELQKNLMDDGIFLPGKKRGISQVTKSAKTNLSTDELKILQNGIERPREMTDKNYIVLNKGEEIEFSFDEKTDIGTLRLQFDLDYSRESVSINKKMRIFAMKLHQGLDFQPMRVANTIVRAFDVYVDGKLFFTTDNNYNSLVKIPLNVKANHVRIKYNETWGFDEVRIFACDFISEA